MVTGTWAAPTPKVKSVCDSVQAWRLFSVPVSSTGSPGEEWSGFSPLNSGAHNFTAVLELGDIKKVTIQSGTYGEVVNL